MQYNLFMFLWFSFSFVCNRILEKRTTTPHAHILIFLKDRSICYDPSQIDRFICAEILNKKIDPKGYTTVENYMIHDPCGDAK
jgi:hypothetical protein